MILAELLGSLLTLYDSRKMTNIRAANNSGVTQETVNGPTELNTDARLKINKKKTELITNSTDTYIKLNGKLLIMSQNKYT